MASEQGNPLSDLQTQESVIDQLTKRCQQLELENEELKKKEEEIQSLKKELKEARSKKMEMFIRKCEAEGKWLRLVKRQRREVKRVCTHPDDLKKGIEGEARS